MVSSYLHHILILPTNSIVFHDHPFLTSSTPVQPSYLANPSLNKEALQGDFIWGTKRRLMKPNGNQETKL